MAVVSVALLKGGLFYTLTVVLHRQFFFGKYLKVNVYLSCFSSIPHYQMHGEIILCGRAARS